ncbi:RNA polymerase sigma-70 factor [Algoriphagus antarcticus]|uniref:RNA polymerase sigma-70 factor (ECF subfamily) n=1 Tax=Algoriphagus antarcticus TaxID=238540 RepID=A0A3E0D7C3_9BACT|nr:RNA polymerase sigma-70 factor [Algoriphagus antarcticus]REG78444.1 RNA polymerase sigma-70 factor (ECF subfamily) [Algoriphagus antarcticus]
MPEKVLNELEIIERIKNDDESAFIEVYELFWKRLFNFGYKKLGKKEIVEGIVQEVFIDFWTRRAKLEIHTSLSSYLFTSVNYRIINQYKSQSIRDKYSAQEKTKGEQNSSSTDEKVLYNDLKSNIKKVVQEFPAQRKKVYQLRFNKGLSYIEIAQNLEISVSTVEKHLMRALKDIRISLRELTLSTLTYLSSDPVFEILGTSSYFN